MDWRQEYEERRKRKEEKEKKKREEREEREYKRKLAKHHRKYKCHVCGKYSEGPYWASGNYIFGVGGGHGGIVWDRPIGLKECSICKKWTCNDCLYFPTNYFGTGPGICKKCANRFR